jgi:hypothetical protein
VITVTLLHQTAQTMKTVTLFDLKAEAGRKIAAQRGNSEYIKGVCEMVSFYAIGKFDHDHIITTAKELGASRSTIDSIISSYIG